MIHSYKEIVYKILAAEKIIITAHRSPDGDSIGSTLGLFNFIKKLGKTAHICHPDPAPEYLNWLPGIDHVLSYEKDTDQVKQFFDQASLIFCLDYNATNRVGEDMQVLLEKAACTKVMIDHHLNPHDFADLMISDTEASSTAELIYELIVQSGHEDKLDGEIGAPLYTGILTDTGVFRFPSVRPRTHEILARLLASGVRHELIHEHLSDNNTESRLRIQGYAMSYKMEILPDCPVAIIPLTATELKQFNYIKGDTDGIPNQALSIKGMKAAIFMAEKEGKLKMSFRSKGENHPVNELAATHFEGGGHANAAGGISYLSIEETCAKLRKLAPTYFSY